mmetsp:Transcript_991/g.2626  ORF Transcript_991/g.2626 Transcript_991/m.2626 type:complete len:222 (+) Transcript_991:139-804(+)
MAHGDCSQPKRQLAIARATSLRLRRGGPPNAAACDEPRLAAHEPTRSRAVFLSARRVARHAATAMRRERVQYRPRFDHAGGQPGGSWSNGCSAPVLWLPSIHSTASAVRLLPTRAPGTRVPSPAGCEAQVWCRKSLPAPPCCAGTPNMAGPPASLCSAWSCCAPAAGFAPPALPSRSAVLCASRCSCGRRKLIKLAAQRVLACLSVHSLIVCCSTASSADR